MEIYKKVKEIVLPTIKAMGYELWGMDISKNNNKVLIKIYLDSIDNNSSVSVDDCALVSRQIRVLFRVENLFSQQYILEVSSPGINRSLFCLTHYQKYINNLINVRLNKPLGNKRNFVGKIVAVFDNKIELLVDNESFIFELVDINKATLIL